MWLSLQRLLHYLSFIFRNQHRRTIRYAFPLVVTFSMVGAAVLLHEDASYIRIAASTNTVSAGDTLTLDVYAGAHAPVNAINIEVEYPEDIISITGIDTGRSVITIWTQEPYVDGDRVILSGGTYRRGFIGEHLIASIDAVAKESGTALFSAKDITFLAGDGSGDEVEVSEKQSSSLAVTVSDVGGVLSGAVDIFVYTDINADGRVGMDDIMAFMEAWANKNRAFDFNGDGKMTFRDFAIILADSFYQ